MPAAAARRYDSPDPVSDAAHRSAPVSDTDDLIDIDAWGPTGPTDPELRQRWLDAIAKRYASGTLDDVLIPKDADVNPLLDALRTDGE